MKYLKLFEAYTDDISKYRDDIIDTLSEYVSLYDDGLVNELIDIGWETTAGDLIDDALNQGEPITKEMITIIVDDISNSNAQRIASRLLNIYNDCLYNIDNTDPNIIDNLKDIFSEYLDDKKAQIYKTADKHDNRYVVLINHRDVLLNLDFKEIIGRVNDLVKLKHMDYTGTNDQIQFEFYESYPDED